MRAIISSIILLCVIVNFGFSQAYIFDGYTDKLSYRAGDTVTFFLNGVGCLFGTNFNAPVIDINGAVANDGSNNIILNFTDINVQSPTNQYNWKDGFGYTASSVKWIIPSGLKSGRYLINTVHSVNNLTIN